MEKIEWHDPREKIWGFHIHQELPKKDFAHALVIQQKCAAFLESQNINVDIAAAFHPGYGPHVEYMWELRVESKNEKMLENMGLAIAWMSVNRFQLSAYFHPLMHDTSLPEDISLQQEGDLNHTNTLWFTRKVKQDQDFFFNPPKNAEQQIIDSRLPSIITDEEQNIFLNAGNKTLRDSFFQDPHQAIKNGFHIHMDFCPKERALALQVFDRFLLYLLEIGLRPTSTRIYGNRENGPHIQSGWEIKFETRDKQVLKNIGIAIGWLMCNRQNLSVFMHPVTWEEGDYEAELNAHANYSMFIGDLPPLDLNFFRKKCCKAANW